MSKPTNLEIAMDTIVELTGTIHQRDKEITALRERAEKAEAQRDEIYLQAANDELDTFSLVKKLYALAGMPDGEPMPPDSDGVGYNFNAREPLRIISERLAELAAEQQRRREAEERSEEAVQLLAYIEANDYSPDEETVREVNTLLRGTPTQEPAEKEGR